MTRIKDFIMTTLSPRDAVIAQSIVNADRILVQSEHTIFCDAYAIKGSMDELNAAYKETVSYLKSTGATVVKVRKNKTLDKIKALEDTLPAALADYQAHYDAVLAGWQSLCPSKDDSPETIALREKTITSVYAMQLAQAHSKPIGKMQDLFSLFNSFRTMHLTETSTAYI